MSYKLKVNKVNNDIYLRLVCEPTFLFFIVKYNFELFLNTINKNKINRTASKINKICKSIYKKNNKFGLMNAKNVSMHSPMQIIESTITALKPFNLLSIKKYQ